MCLMVGITTFSSVFIIMGFLAGQANPQLFPPGDIIAQNVLIKWL
jgi:hypothetical protein